MTGVLLCVLLLSLGGVQGFSKGAPSGQCQAMFPAHSGTPSSSNPFPYVLVTSSKAYSPGETLTVALRGSVPFKGFIIKAVDQSGNAVGTMVAPAGSSTLPCGRQGKEGLTHTDNSEKNSFTFRWTAPPIDVGSIKFRATVVYGYTTFWVNQEMATISPAVATTRLAVSTVPPPRRIVQITFTDSVPTSASDFNPLVVTNPFSSTTSTVTDDLSTNPPTSSAKTTHVPVSLVSTFAHSEVAGPELFTPQRTRATFLEQSSTTSIVDPTERESTSTESTTETTHKQTTKTTAESTTTFSEPSLERVTFSPFVNPARLPTRLPANISVTSPATPRVETTRTTILRSTPTVFGGFRFPVLITFESEPETTSPSVRQSTARRRVPILITFQEEEELDSTSTPSGRLDLTTRGSPLDTTTVKHTTSVGPVWRLKSTTQTPIDHTSSQHTTFRPVWSLDSTTRTADVEASSLTPLDHTSGQHTTFGPVGELESTTGINDWQTSRASTSQNLRTEPPMHEIDPSRPIIKRPDPSGKTTSRRFPDEDQNELRTDGFTRTQFPRFRTTNTNTIHGQHQPSPSLPNFLPETPRQIWPQLVSTTRSQTGSTQVFDLSTTTRGHAIDHGRASIIPEATPTQAPRPRARPIEKVPTTKQPSNVTTTKQPVEALTTKAPHSTTSEETKTLLSDLKDGTIQYDPECGSSKGCFVRCSGTECEYMVTWRDEGDSVAFEIYGKFEQVDSWVAVGFSSNIRMGDDSVTECVHNGGVVRVFNSYNPDYHNVRLENPTAGLSNVAGSYANGVLSCRFNRIKRSPIEPKLFDLEKDWHIMFAHGGAMAGFQINMHPVEPGHLPPTSAAAVDFQSFAVIGSGGQYAKVKAHGCLMIFSWVLFTGIGIMVARYYKSTWSEKTFLQQKIWFQIHRSCMIAALITDIVAFIIIFIEAGGYSKIGGSNGRDYLKAHPILGIIITILAITNPIMSLFRPGPGTKNRPIFNWCHWAVGMSAYILSVICICFGFQLGKSSTPAYAIYIMIAYVIYIIVFDIVMEIIDYLAKKDNKGASNSIELNGVNGTNGTDNGIHHGASNLSKDTLKKQNDKMKTILLALHIALTGAFAIVLVLVVALN